MKGMIRLELLIPVVVALTGCGPSNPNPIDFAAPPDKTIPVKLAASPADSQTWAERDLTLPDVSGGKFTLSSLKGKYVLLDFWASWCGPCIKAIPHLNKLQDRFPGQLEVVGISVDDEPLSFVQKFARDNKMNYRVLHGEDKLIDRFGRSRGLPVAFLLDPEGRVVRRFIGEYPEDRLISAIAGVIPAKEEKKDESGPPSESPDPQ
ncbi:MAG: TlpA family protein disulfide reductase [Deltaproteobacteria bacterium]|nr:TlpA family protein disulfide reductase [Deltaproteobacteria bacterium]